MSFGHLFIIGLYDQLTTTKKLICAFFKSDTIVFVFFLLRVIQLLNIEYVNYI
jgi:hypothetical protein